MVTNDLRFKLHLQESSKKSLLTVLSVPSLTEKISSGGIFSPTPAVLLQITWHKRKCKSITTGPNWGLQLEWLWECLQSQGAKKPAMSSFSSEEAEYAGCITCCHLKSVELLYKPDNRDAILPVGLSSSTIPEWNLPHRTLITEIISPLLLHLAMINTLD